MNKTAAQAQERVGVFARFRAFLKSNSDMIIKLFFHQIGLTFFGYTLYIAAATAKSKALTIGLGIFSAVFYLFLLYVMAWDIGSKEKIRIDGGRMRRDPFKGAKVALVGMLPNLIIALTVLVAYLIIDKGSLTDGAYTQPAWAVALYGGAQLIGLFINAMYLGIGDVTGIAYTPYYLFIICIPAIVVCCIGYYFGTFDRFGVFKSLYGSNNKKNR